jgi:hypothetical protein
MNDEAKKQKNHGRAAGQIQTSIALPEDLLKKIREIAEREDRSCNRQIVKMLREQEEKYTVKTDTEGDRS